MWPNECGGQFAPGFPGDLKHLLHYGFMGRHDLRKTTKFYTILFKRYSN